MSKYRNKRTNGYASMKEAARAQELKILERTGEISCLREQVPFVLIPAYPGRQRGVKFIADFTYWQGTRQVCEDVKGFRTKDYILKRKLMWHVHGIEVREV